VAGSSGAGVESPGVSNVEGSSGAVVESPGVLQVVNVKSGPLWRASARVCWRLGGSGRAFQSHVVQLTVCFHSEWLSWLGRGSGETAFRPLADPDSNLGIFI